MEHLEDLSYKGIYLFGDIWESFWPFAATISIWIFITKFTFNKGFGIYFIYQYISWSIVLIMHLADILAQFYSRPHGFPKAILLMFPLKFKFRIKNIISTFGLRRQPPHILTNVPHIKELSTRLNYFLRRSRHVYYVVAALIDWLCHNYANDKTLITGCRGDYLI